MKRTRHKSIAKLLIQLYVNETVCKLLLEGSTPKVKAHLNEMLFHIEAASLQLYAIVNLEAKKGCTNVKTSKK